MSVTEKFYPCCHKKTNIEISFSELQKTAFFKYWGFGLVGCTTFGKIGLIYDKINELLRLEMQVKTLRSFHTAPI